MKKIILASMVMTFANTAFAWNETCTCSLDYKQKTGYLYTETVSVECPEGERYDLSCEGFEFVNTLEVKCQNRSSFESNTASSFPTPDGEPTSPWPRCSF